MRCQNCKTEISGSPKFCPKCGGKIEVPALQSDGTKNCPQCGTENALAAKFCKKDGYRFDSVAETSAMPTVSTAPAATIKESGETMAENVPTKIPPADDSVMCPKCGTPSLAGAKFCKKDGYNFGAAAQAVVVPVQSPVAPPVSTPVLKAVSTAPPPAAITPVVTPVDVPKVQEPVSRSAPPPSDSVTCPKCGTANIPTAKFCKKDGYPLQAADAAATPTAVPPAVPPVKQAAMASAVSPPAPNPVPAIQPISAAPRPSISAASGAPLEHTTAKSRKGMMIGAALGAVLLAGIGGGYAYWTGYIGNRQGSVQNEINAELASRGLSNIKVTVNDDWVASLAGTVSDQASKDRAFGLVSVHKELKSIVNGVQIQLNATDVEKNLNKALTEAGFSSVPTVQIDKDWVATLRGSANDQPEKDRMLALVTSVAGIKGVRDEIEVAPETIPEPENPDLAEVTQLPSPPPLLAVPQNAPQGVAARTALSNELNDRLRANGVSGVTGRVNPDMSVALSGTVRSADERYRALTIGGSLTGANGVHENIQIASPQVVKLAPPKAPQESTAIDPAKLEGDINRALRSRDINSVTAQVNDDMSLTLKGSASAVEKERAIQFARQVKGIRGVKDKVFVVE